MHTGHIYAMRYARTQANCKPKPWEAHSIQEDMAIKSQINKTCSWERNIHTSHLSKLMPRGDKRVKLYAYVVLGVNTTQHSLKGPQCSTWSSWQPGPGPLPCSPRESPRTAGMSSGCSTYREENQMGIARNSCFPFLVFSERENQHLSLIILCLHSGQAEYTTPFVQCNSNLSHHLEMQRKFIKPSLQCNSNISNPLFSATVI